ncbi:MAG: AarF/ABC1/UbiB kinase family protein [Bacteroidia bacterium]|nr:AarF/ABC1/UbiB kinase family protein [Bacteroidia bacterium]
MGILSYFDKKYIFLKRYNQIIRVMMKYGFDDFVSYLEEKKRFRFLKKLIPKTTIERATHLTKWEKMRLVCEELGPTFVKFGQILSNRPDLLPEKLIYELEKLQDKVPPLPGKVALQVIETELKKPVSELFASIEEEAFASASMAQVHHATLKTGEKVVLKVQRPGIKEMIESDIKVMYYVAGIFSRRIPSLKSFDPPGLVKNFEESITRELDFIYESINIQRFHHQFHNDKSDEGEIYAPEVHPEFTTERVLTMEFIDGTKISKLERLKKEGYDPTVLARRLAVSFFKQIFEYGFFHADPHPGNLLAIPVNRICYLDFGMMGNIMRKDIEQLGYLFIAVKQKDVRKIIRALQSLSDNPVIRNFRDLESDLNEFVQNHHFRSVHSNEMSHILMSLKDIIIRHGLRVPSHFFLLGRSMVTIEGVIHKLDPDLDLIDLARPYLIKTVAKQYNPFKFAKRVFNSVYEMGMYMEDFPRDLKNAIRKINTGEIKVDLRHKGIDPLVHTINRVTRQIITSIIGAALIIGGTLMLIYKVPPLWDDTSFPGICSFVIAAILVVGMLRDLRKGDHDEWPGWDE